MGYYDGDCLLDAERITAWFRRRFQNTTLPPSLERRSRDWRIAGYAPFASVDNYLGRYDWHAWEIPDDVWLDSKEGQCPRCGNPVGLQNYGQCHSRFCGDCHNIVRHRKGHKKREPVR